MNVPILKSGAILPDGSQFWLLGVREEGGNIELVGTAESTEEAVEMAQGIIESKGWVQVFIGAGLESWTVDLSKVEQRKHGSGYYFVDRREEVVDLKRPE